MRKHLITAALAATGLILVAMPSDAAARPQFTDDSGDSLVAGADIVSGTFQTTFKKVRKHGRTKNVPTGFALKLSLAAAPADNVWYEVKATAPGCKEFNFDYSTSKLGDGPIGAGCASATATDYIDGITPTVSGSTITWKFPSSKMAVGSRFGTITAVTYNLTSAPEGVFSLGYPAWDQAAAAASTTYVVGK